MFAKMVRGASKAAIVASAALTAYKAAQAMKDTSENEAYSDEEKIAIYIEEGAKVFVSVASISLLRSLGRAEAQINA